MRSRVPPASLRLAPEPFLGRLRAREHRAVTTLVEAAVVGETYFFRHPEQLAAIRQLAIAATPRERPLAIWSAGCATGEEPYTLAMELLDAGRIGLGDQILATDVSSRALAVAKEARYGEWSFRRLDPVVRNRHFESQPPQVLVRPQIRAMVEFRRHNLVREPAPATGFDLVVCRNVLIYFNPPTASLVVEKLAVTLAPGGILVLGPVEAPLATTPDLERIELDGVTVFRAPGGRPLPLLARTRSASADRARGERARAAEKLTDGKRHGGKKQAAAPTSSAGGRRGAARAHPAVPAAGGNRSSSLEAARDAARRGDLPAAEQLARVRRHPGALSRGVAAGLHGGGCARRPGGRGGRGPARPLPRPRAGAGSRRAGAPLRSARSGTRRPPGHGATRWRRSPGSTTLRPFAASRPSLPARCAARSRAIAPRALAASTPGSQG